jgi:hypothetical protein
VLFSLAGVERPAAGDPVDRDEGAAEDNVGTTCSFSVPDRLLELQRLPTSGSTTSLTNCSDQPPN